MKKRIFSLLLCFCMAASLLPATALATESGELVGIEDNPITTYVDLIDALKKTDIFYEIYVDGTNFDWTPTDTDTNPPPINLGDKTIIIDGTWTVPENITLLIGNNSGINPQVEGGLPKESNIDLKGTIIRVVDKNQNTLEMDCDVHLYSSATIKFETAEGADAKDLKPALSILEDRTWTLDQGAKLEVENIGLEGTLTGNGTVDSNIQVDRKSHTGEGSAVGSNAVLSGNLTLHKTIRIGDAVPCSLTIPKDSVINFEAEPLAEQPEGIGGTTYYTEIVLNDNATLNVNGTLNVKQKAETGNGDFDNDTVHFNRGPNKVLLGEQGVLNFTYPCMISLSPREDGSVLVDGSGKLQFHHDLTDAQLNVLLNRDSMEFRYRNKVARMVEYWNDPEENVLSKGVHLIWDWDCNGKHAHPISISSKAATCTQNGWEISLCPGCMEQKNEKIPSLGHNISTTKDSSDNKYHCLRPDCDVALDTEPVKLAAPTELLWGKIRGNGTDGLDRPGAISWKLTEADHGHIYDVKVYKEAANGNKVLVWNESYPDRSDRNDLAYYSVSDFADTFDNAVESGNYYFTVQTKADPRSNIGCYCNASDEVHSETWSYTNPKRSMATPSGLSWDGGTAKWTGISDKNLESYKIQIYYSETNANATSVDSLRYFDNDSPDANTLSWTPSAERLADFSNKGYIYFTVQAVSDDVTAVLHSDVSELSSALDISTITGGTTTPPTPSDNPGSNPSSGSSSSSRPSTSTTTTNPDGSTTTTTTDKNSGTTTETTQNTDGSQTVVKTESNGTVTTTDTDTNGNKTETVAKPDGSSVTTVAQTDGTTASVATASDGKVEAEVKLPDAVVNTAQESGKAVVLPIQEVQATRNTETAPAVTVNTGSSQSVKVDIPLAAPTPGTVAVLVNDDGTEEIIKTSVATQDGLAVDLPDGATVTIVDNSKPFDDVTETHWAEDAVDFVSARELFSGTSEDTFAPEEPMTRAMLMTVLARFDGEDTSSGDTWYEKGMDWAVSNSISDGSAPDANISREQLATMLWRYSGSPAVEGDLDGFADAGQVSDYAQEAMRWAVQQGIIHGFGNGELGPQGPATRAQVSQMLKNFIEES